MYAKKEWRILGKLQIGAHKDEDYKPHETFELFQPRLIPDKLALVTNKCLAWFHDGGDTRQDPERVKYICAFECDLHQEYSLYTLKLFKETSCFQSNDIQVHLHSKKEGLSNWKYGATSSGNRWMTKDKTVIWDLSRAELGIWLDEMPLQPILYATKSQERDHMLIARWLDKDNCLVRPYTQ